MKPISIVYDGQIEVSDYGVFTMGSYPLSGILKKALHLDDGEYRTMNAAVTIQIEVKPNQPLISGGGDAEC